MINNNNNNNKKKKHYDSSGHLTSSFNHVSIYFFKKKEKEKLNHKTKTHLEQFMYFFNFQRHTMSWSLALFRFQLCLNWSLLDMTV